jgi:formylglycine-generating enzyme required for sulfatase activity
MVGLTLGVLILAACAGLRPGPTLSVGSTQVREQDDMLMVYVPGGTFLMGTEESDPAVEPYEVPQHSVTLDSFWMDQTEVTNAQYAGCVTAGVCSPPYQPSSATRESYHGDSQYADYPVIRVSWHDATTYCAWAGGRLPSEAEWEYAARGPEGRVNPWGDDPPDDTLLNYNRTVGDTTPVGSYARDKSWAGALDMAGNVSEWVNDWYDADYYAVSPAENPTGPDTGELKAMRGGSWFNPVYFIRSAWRSRLGPEFQDPSVGFRCVVAAESSP